MDARPTIYLVGLAGSGKSTLGKQLARLLSMTFVDLDREIVRLARKSIPEIFEQEGEAAFRALEHQSLVKISKLNTSHVVATGGGAPCFYQNMALMNDTGVAIYLDVSVEALADRVTSAGVSRRPLFNGLDRRGVIDAIAVMKEKRLPFYQQAAIKIKGDQITADLIASCLTAEGYL